MGYRNDQFYKLSTMSSGERKGWEFISDGTSHWAHSANNPPFIYPNRDIRVYDSDGRPETKLLKRGFMRNIPRLDSEPQFKCQFQFNPQTLTQDVSYSESIYNHYLRDPGSFAQPQAGNGTMAFTILFDRSMEINNPVGTGGPTYDPARGGFIAVDGNARPDIRNPWETGSPQYVGVLRDIAALYSVIGQGVNKSELAGQLDAAKTLLKSEALSLGPDASNAFNSDEYKEALAAIDTAFEQQVGNYAFLAPKPVRMVFSSLYIVEGYVTTSSVTFSKFNSSYVPIQAQVHLTMSVQHIGFAKQDTYTTYAIEEAKKFREAQEEAVRQENLTAFDSVKAALTDWKASIINDTGVDATAVPSDWDSSVIGGASQQWMRLTCSSNDFDGVRDLFDLGATTIYITGEWYFWTDLDIPPRYGDPDSMSPAPKFTYYFNSVNPMTTKEQFDRTFPPIAGGRLDGYRQSVTQFEPINEYGGNWRLSMKIAVEVFHNGGRLVGTGAYNKLVTNSDISDWNATPLFGDITLSWTASGDTISTDPLSPTTIPFLQSGEPSSVGAE